MIVEVGPRAFGQASRTLEELAFSIRGADLEQFLDLSAIEAPITPNFEGWQFAALDELVDGRPIDSQESGHLGDCQHFVHGYPGTVAESG